MNNIDKLTRRLAAQEPELKGADDLLESIMNSLPEQEEIENIPTKRKISLWLNIGRWSSSIAALFLIALFVSQQLTMEKPESMVDYSEILSAYNSDYTMLKKSSSPEETIHAVIKEKMSRVGIAELREQYAQMK